MTSDRKYWHPLLVCGLFAALSKLLSEATDLTLKPWTVRLRLILFLALIELTSFLAPQQSAMEMEYQGLYKSYGPTNSEFQSASESLNVCS
jgi:hypothetical protein